MRYIFILDSDFQHLAQMSHAHTLVGLARSTNVNPKFFLSPRNISWTKEVKIIIFIIIVLFLFDNYNYLLILI